MCQQDTKAVLYKTALTGALKIQIKGYLNPEKYTI